MGEAGRAERDRVRVNNECASSLILTLAGKRCMITDQMGSCYSEPRTSCRISRAKGLDVTLRFLAALGMTILLRVSVTVH